MCLLHFTFHLKEKNYLVLSLPVRNLFTSLSAVQGSFGNSRDAAARGRQSLRTLGAPRTFLCFPL